MSEQTVWVALSAREMTEVEGGQRGGDGADVLRGGAGNDTLLGGTGNGVQSHNTAPFDGIYLMEPIL